MRTKAFARLNTDESVRQIERRTICTYDDAIGPAFPQAVKLQDMQEHVASIDLQVVVDDRGDFFLGQ
jgi:hypothetical protein